MFFCHHEKKKEAHLEVEQALVRVHGRPESSLPGPGHASLGGVAHSGGGHLVEGDLAPIVLKD